MMGRRSEQWSLFYQFRLDERVPKDHLLRRIDRFVTAALADIHDRLEPYYSDIGRPSVDPELMIRMLIVGYWWPTVGTQVDAGSRIAFGLSLVLPARS